MVGTRSRPAPTLPTTDLMSLAVNGVADLIVQHTWKKENAEAAFAVVKSIVGMANSGQLPAGYTLKSVNVVAGDNRAFCTWQAPSKQSLEQLVGQVNPPTEHSVYEVQKIF